jgi:outer membrane protein assembly factor BamE (lipoprotein component of BamABCDE complex)
LKRRRAHPKGLNIVMKVALLRLPVALSVAIMLIGCASVRTHRGAVIDPQLASAIQPGVDNKASVEKLLGRPSFTGQFMPNDWYYVSRDTAQFAFRNPRTMKQTVMLVRFDPAGNVAAVQRTGKELALNVNPSNRETPTLGRKHSFFQELFNNIGTVGAPGLPGSNNGPGY